jgi:hypothetical protein
VRPPFAAAPIEGRRARTWLGLGIAGGLLAACCGVGGVATGGLLLLSEEATNEQAQRAVDDYLTAVTEADWERAYELRCEADRRTESLRAFTRRVSAPPRITSYEVGDLQLEPGDNMFDPETAVPVDVVYADGSEAVLTVPLERDPGTGQFQVCGTVDQG